MTKQRDKACKQNIKQILLLDSNSLGFEFFGFGILNCQSLHVCTIYAYFQKTTIQNSTVCFQKKCIFLNWVLIVL